MSLFLHPTSVPVATQTQRASSTIFAGYSPFDGCPDELFDANGTAHAFARAIVDRIDELGPDQLRIRQELANVAFRKGGITFSVYSDAQGVEKIFPFDLIPRVIGSKEWEQTEAGLVQRVEALNAFLRDIYGKQHILRDGTVPRDLIEQSTGFVPEVMGIRPRKGIYVHIAGVDLVRGGDGALRVLEDNIRCPSGVSYVLENRAIMKRAFPRLFEKVRVRPVDEYPTRLRTALSALGPGDSGSGGRVAVLTPGSFNSAYFEHAFLARRMGCELVEGPDLVVHDGVVNVKTTRGLQKIDVLYRRIDDAFLDPEAFRPDSLLGVPGLFDAYRRGNVSLANAIGNGVADDKAVYPYLPDVIRYYLKQEPILPQVPTYRCRQADDLAYVLEHLEELVVKKVDGAGGYGMLFGPRSTRDEREEFAAKIEEHPNEYIAQPVVELSTGPVWDGNEILCRRVDLRPYIVTGDSTWVVPGGLTRVALAEGSYIVNSSQGGGSKDTWVIEELS